MALRYRSSVNNLAAPSVIPSRSPGETMMPASCAPMTEAGPTTLVVQDGLLMCRRFQQRQGIRILIRRQGKEFAALECLVLLLAP